MESTQEKNTQTLSANLPDSLTENLNLAHLQDYMRRMVEQRGFAHESPRDTMLLMVEEIGELAKAVRKTSGIKVDSRTPAHQLNLEDELADVLIYLLVLANRCNVDLFKALRQKELKNATRTWK